MPAATPEPPLLARHVELEMVARGLPGLLIVLELLMELSGLLPLLLKVLVPLMELEGLPPVPLMVLVLPPAMLTVLELLTEAVGPLSVLLMCLARSTPRPFREPWTSCTRS